MVPDEVEVAEAPGASRGVVSPLRSQWRKRLLLALLVVAVVVLLVYAFAGGGAPASAPVSQGGLVSDPGMAAADTADDGDGVALILSGPTHDSRAETGTHAGHDDLTSSLLATPSSAAAGESVQNQLADRISGKRRAPRRHTAARPHKTDSDVALLTALIAHVEKGGPDAWEKTRKLAHHEDLLELRMQECPRANTKAGLDCRQRICKGHEGQSPACPAPAGKD